MAETKHTLTNSKVPSLRKNSAWMLGSQLLRSGVQFLYFVLIARALGSQQYGAFIAVTALTSIAAPFASWGSGNLLVQHVARDPKTFSTYWGAALATTAVSASLLVVLLLGVGGLLLPHGTSLLLLFLLATADLLFARLIDISGQAFQAVQRLDRTAVIQFIPAVVRLLAAVVLFFLPLAHTALLWAGLFLGATLISALICLYWVRRDLGWGPLRLQPVLTDLRTGGAYAVSLSAQGVYNDIDKTMLARMVSVEAAGTYAAAYRVIDVAFTPVRSVLYASYARFFQHGEKGLQSSVRFALKLLPWMVLYGALSAVGLWLIAPILPILFGADFTTSIDVLRWLSPLILLKALHYFAADTLTGAGFQSWRSAVQVLVAVLNVGLNLWLLPRYGWLGAVWASLASDFLLAMILWGRVLRDIRGTPI